MSKLKLLLVVTLLGLWVMGGNLPNANAHSGKIHANEKSAKELLPWLKKLLPTAKSFKNLHVGLPDAGVVGRKVKALGTELKDHDFHPPIYIGIGSNGKSIGLAFFTLSKNDSDIGVALDPNLNVISAVGFSGVFANLPSAFLTQFKGKSVATPFVLGKTIHLKGANPVLAKEMAAQIKKVQFILEAWKKTLGKPKADKSSHKGHTGH